MAVISVSAGLKQPAIKKRKKKKAFPIFCLLHVLTVPSGKCQVPA